MPKEGSHGLRKELILLFSVTVSFFPLAALFFVTFVSGSLSAALSLSLPNPSYLSTQTASENKIVDQPASPSPSQNKNTGKA